MLGDISCNQRVNKDMMMMTMMMMMMMIDINMAVLVECHNFHLSLMEQMMDRTFH